MAACAPKETARLDESAPQVAAAADLAVYAAVIDSLYAADARVDTLLIHQIAVRDPGPFDEDTSYSAVRARLQRLEGIPSDAIDDFIRANAASATIRDSIPTRRAYRLSDPHVGGPMPEAPASRALVFSRVGYAETGREAIVSVDFHCPLCGEGRTLLLSRTDSGWRVIAELLEWIS